MKKTILIWGTVLCLIYFQAKAQSPNPAANPFVSGISAAKSPILVGETTTVSIGLGNNGVDPIPAGGAQWNVSFPPNVIVQQNTVNFNGGPFTASWNVLSGIGTFLTIATVAPGIAASTSPPTTTTSFTITVDITGGAVGGPLQQTANALPEPTIAQNLNAGDDNATGAIEVTSLVPLVLKTFDVKKVNCSALLSWSTLSEQNTKEFIIERSNASNSSNYTRLGVIAASGNSSSLKNYDFTDTQVEEGHPYLYRLKMVDIDGKYTYSNVVSFRMNCNTSNGTLDIYPNPAVKMVTISGTKVDISDGEKVGINVYNALGQLIESVEIVSSNRSLSYTIDISTWAEGHYIVNLKGKEGHLKESLRFVKSD